MIKEEYAVTSIKKECDGVKTLTLTPSSGKIIDFICGQFLTVYMPLSPTAEGKAYSLSRVPNGSTYSITVKDIGEFSHFLCTRIIGDNIIASGPYGYFYSEEESSTLVLIASGIGITPFYSMLCGSIEKHPHRKIHLYYSVKYMKDAIFVEEMSLLQKNNPYFSFFIHVTQEDVFRKGYQRGRISSRSVVEDFGDFYDIEYFVCGSISFVRDLWKGLRACGIKEEKIYTEAFFT